MIIGTWLFTKMRGELVGTDAEGNRYFQDKRIVPGMRRKRWVMYNGVAEASGMAGLVVGGASGDTASVIGGVLGSSCFL